MLRTLANLTGVKVLSKDAQKKIMGAGGCGVKVEGVWHPASDNNGDGATIDDARGLVGHYVSGYDPNNWSYPGSMVVYPGGEYSGYATNWCCDSCPWNGTYQA